MKKVFGVSLALILAAMLFMGCGGKAASSTSSQTLTTSAAASSTSPTASSASPTTSITGTPPSTTPTTSATATKTTAASSTPSTSGNDLSGLLGKAAGYTSFYVEIKTTSGTVTQNMKEWVKTGNPTKFRMEITAVGLGTTVMIYNGQDYYMYMPDSNTAYKMSMASAQQYSSASSDSSSITQYNPVYVGSETVNGVDCSVYQYTASGVLTKMWLSKQNGLTVRMVSGTTTMDYTNYSFAAIADSMFTLPSGAMMITMPY